MELQSSLQGFNEPYSIDAEQSILGAILLDASVISEILSKVKLEYFYNDYNKSIFSILIRMYTSSKKIDAVTVLNEVEKENIFESKDKARLYLTSLMQVVPTVSNIDSYADILNEKYIMRSLLLVSKYINEGIENYQDDGKKLLDLIEQKIYDIRKDKNIDGLVRIDEIIVNTYDRLQELSLETNREVSGIRSGFSCVDKIISGLNKSDLILIAARPGMGKTSFALNIANNVARLEKKAVCIFSLEMSKEQLVSRMLSSEARIESYCLKNGKLNSDQWIRLAKTSDMISKCPIYIDDSSNINVLDIKSKLRKIKDVGLVIIDYLQLMSTGRYSNNRVQEITEITRNLKILAKDLDVPVITLSQLSRGPESRINNHRPMLSDLRDSGSIEQDADIVMFLYRESYYNKEMEEDRNIAECIVAKNRHGEVNTARLYWDGEYTRFTSLEVYRDGQ